MKKKSITYSDLSKKQLQNLKELYIQKKVQSMSHSELEKFFLEVISHQINDTIGKEEEMEAWREISSFFGEKFEIIIHEIKTKHPNNDVVQDLEEDTQKHRLELLEKNNAENGQKDMWVD